MEERCFFYLFCTLRIPQKLAFAYIFVPVLMSNPEKSSAVRNSFPENYLTVKDFPFIQCISVSNW